MFSHEAPSTDELIDATLASRSSPVKYLIRLHQFQNRIDSPMDLRQIKCFVTLAQELHFGRAAQRLHMTQPPLSQQIKRLEESIGVQLLERSSRSVRLTQAGSAFLPRCSELLLSAEAARRAARLAAQGESGELRIGYSASALYSEVVLAAIAQYRRRYPAVEIRLVEGTTPSNVQDLAKARLDTAFVRGPLPVDAGDWPSRQRSLLENDRLVLAMPRSHALRDRKAVSLHDLEAETMISLDRSRDTALNQLLDQLFIQGGVRPAVSIETSEIAGILGLVGAGAGVAIVPAAVVARRSRYLVTRPLRDKGARIALYQLMPQRACAAATMLREIVGHTLRSAGRPQPS